MSSAQFEQLEEVPRDVLFRAKQLGYSDPQLANLYLGDITTETILQVRDYRKRLGIEPVYKLVDTCAAEFEAETPYFYSTYEPPARKVSDGAVDAAAARPADEIRVSEQPKVVILGGGPNRIGQGIEFDYCCCQASFACREMGIESVMINSNPETVEHRLRHERSALLRAAHARGHAQRHRTPQRRRRRAWPAASGGVVGAIVQFGGQTPLNLAHGLVAAGVPIIGTSLESIDLAEDRDRFKAMLDELRLKQPASGIAHSLEEAVAVAESIGYPVLVRPSYVLGGRGMETCFDEAALRQYMRIAVDVSELAQRAGAHRPVPLRGGRGRCRRRGGLRARRRGRRSDVAEPQAVICGIMEHIEEAGVHSGDSTCTMPPFSLPPFHLRSHPQRRPSPGEAPRRARPDERADGREGRRGLHHRGQSRARRARCRSWPRQRACRGRGWPPR